MGQSLFGEIVRRAELVSIEPVSMRASRGENGEKKRELAMEESFSQRISEDRCKLLVTYEFLVSEVTADGEAVEGGFESSIEYEVRYQFSPPLTPEHDKDLSLFAEHNAKFNCWSYLRGYLSRTTAEMGLPVLNLPLLKPYAPNPGDENK